MRKWVFLGSVFLVLLFFYLTPFRQSPTSERPPSFSDVQRYRRTYLDFCVTEGYLRSWQREGAVVRLRVGDRFFEFNSEEQKIVASFVYEFFFDDPDHIPPAAEVLLLNPNGKPVGRYDPASGLRLD